LGISKCGLFCSYGHASLFYRPYLRFLSVQPFLANDDELIKPRYRRGDNRYQDERQRSKSPASNRFPFQFPIAKLLT